MNLKERIKCALELKEPDRVPVGEFVFADNLTGGTSGYTINEAVLLLVTD